MDDKTATRKTKKSTAPRRDISEWKKSAHGQSDGQDENECTCEFTIPRKKELVDRFVEAVFYTDVLAAFIKQRG